MNAQLMTWMGDTLVSMTILMAVVLMLRKPVRTYFGPQIAYMLWCIPLARLFMPILTLEASAPVSESSAGGELAPILIGTLSETGQATAVAAGTAVATTSFLSSIDWLMVAIIIWLGGAGLMFVSKLAAYFQFREDIILDGQLVGRHGNIKVVETAAVSGPLAFGLFDKYIAVPADFFRNYAPRERELALDHEIAHHESGDLLANFMGLLVLSLHWFNPLAWLAWMAFRQDQETACDARILNNNGQDVRAIYGRTIAKSLSTQRLGLASPLGHKSKIKSRIKLLGQGQASSLRKRIGMMMVGTSAVVALPLTATISYAEKSSPAAENKYAGTQIQSAGTTVDVGDDGVYVIEKTDNIYKYTVSNDRGKFEFTSKRKLEKSEIDAKLSRMVPSFNKTSWSEEPAAPSRPIPPAAHNDDADEVINITMMNGSKDFANDKQYVHRIKHDGRTIILRTNKKLSDEDVREMVEEAEESRIEADKEAREYEREHRAHEREMRIKMREVEREAKEAAREAQQEIREAQQEAREAAIEATRNIRISMGRTSVRNSARTRSNSHQHHLHNAHNHVAAPVPPTPPVGPVPALQTISLNIDAIAGHDKRFLKLTLETLKSARSDFNKSCKDKSPKDKMKLKAYDREIEHLEQKLTSV